MIQIILKFIMVIIQITIVMIIKGNSNNSKLDTNKIDSNSNTMIITLGIIKK